MPAQSARRGSTTLETTWRWAIRHCGSSSRFWRLAQARLTVRIMLDVNRLITTDGDVLRLTLVSQFIVMTLRKWQYELYRWSDVELLQPFCDGAFDAEPSDRDPASAAVRILRAKIKASEKLQIVKVYRDKKVNFETYGRQGICELIFCSSSRLNWTDWCFFGMQNLSSCL